MQLTLFESEVEKFISKAEEVKTANMQLHEENEQLKKRISELEAQLSILNKGTNDNK
nr:MAG TPA: cell division protein [Caudoviricetes sp.]